MNYKLINVTPISKFTILGMDQEENKHSNNINISNIFWNKLLSETYLKNFFSIYYDIYKKQKEDEKSYNFFIKEYSFVLNNINFIKKNINCFSNTQIPSGEDIFFSFRIFTAIISYYNEYFSNSDAKIDLREGIIYKKQYHNVEEFFESIEYYSNTEIYKKIIFPIVIDAIKNKVSKTGKYILKFHIFWPGEFVTISLISKILKKYNSNIKIAIDFSVGNEQFDFSQWIKLIKSSGQKFFNDFDYFIIDRDFGRGLDQLVKSLNSGGELKDISNVMYFQNNEIIYKEIIDEDLSVNMFDVFIESTFSKNNIHQTFGKKSVYSRFLPYKCYWNSCNFCAINSQNKFTFNRKYNYDFFIDKWVEFIEENNIYSINFKDEAIPPVAILGFAKKVIERGLKINYQFRTRYEKFYTKENCKILSLSGARFCGIGLESAVDRVNEKIGNKGNSNLSLIDKIRIIHNFDRVGIGIHNYAIVGFPGEQEDEVLMTYKFLKSNIIKSNYFTCTPNIFGLMKGPEIFTNRKKYKISIDEKQIDNPFMLIFDFKCNGKKRNINLLKKVEGDLHRIQFLPWIDESNYTVSPRGFWDYIDRSFIFYLMKRYHKTSPYYKYKNINKGVLEMDFEEILNIKFKISPYIQLFKYDGDEIMYIYDWCLCDDVLVPKSYKNFIEKYDNNFTLIENLEKEKNGIDQLLLKKIIEKRILMMK